MEAEDELQTGLEEANRGCDIAVVQHSRGDGSNDTLVTPQL